MLVRWSVSHCDPGAQFWMGSELAGHRMHSPESVIFSLNKQSARLT